MQASIKLFRENKFTILLLSLLLNILLIPAVASLSSDQFPNIGRIALSASITLLMFVAIFVTSTSRLTKGIALLLMLPALVLMWARLGIPYSSWQYILQQLLLAAFLCLVTISLIKYVFTCKKVTFDLINAALCAYLIIGFLWVSLYAVVESTHPGSFLLPEDGLGAFIGHDQNGDLFSRQLYFSFVTLLTLGYGDLVPVHSVTRLLAITEAFVGQIFLVVLVARLVGVHVAQSLEN
jgi:hypothetical protein